MNTEAPPPNKAFLYRGYEIIVQYGAANAEVTLYWDNERDQHSRWWFAWGKSRPVTDDQVVRFLWEVMRGWLDREIARLWAVQ